jgi:predicted DNA-binding transcriptional regulator AlpA
MQDTSLADTTISNVRPVRVSAVQRRLLRLPDVLEIVGVSKSTWWAGIKAGVYPQPVHPSSGRSAWPSDVIDALVDRICASGASQHKDAA